MRLQLRGNSGQKRSQPAPCDSDFTINIIAKNATPTPGQLQLKWESESAPCESDSRNRLTSKPFPVLQNFLLGDAEKPRSLVIVITFPVPPIWRQPLACQLYVNTNIEQLIDSLIISPLILFKPSHPRLIQNNERRRSRSIAAQCVRLTVTSIYRFFSAEQAKQWGTCYMRFYFPACPI